ncbi:MAG: CHASE2 domain-containing protein [Candidatus Omnitrophica bacterium]|nr:CHASE2 domain-containing protein [Candidatus Omnitrophota bacterium]
MISFNKKTVFINLLLALFLSTFIVIVSKMEFMKRFEYFTTDICFRIRGLRRTDQPIVIIEITDSDVSKIGRWPWNRGWHATIAKVLSDLGAQAIYFDVIFSEPQDEKNDSLFEGAIKVSGKVFLPYVFPARPFVKEDALMPIARLSADLMGMGAMNVYPDEDGTIRKIPLLFIGQKGTYPHIALEIFRKTRGLDIKKIYDTKVVLSDKTGNLVDIPLDAKTNLTINWKGKWIQTFRHYSFIDLLAAYKDTLDKKETSIDLSPIKGAICLVGVTAFGLYDIKPIPLEPEYPGIGIIANALSTLIARDFIREVPGWVNILLTYLLAVIPAFFVSGANPFRETMLIFTTGFVYGASAFLLFANGIKIEIFTPIFSLSSSAIAVNTYCFFTTVLEKRKLFDIAVTDGLTGLINIRHFKVLLSSEIKLVEAGVIKGFSLVLSDIDHFKKFNDTYGHQVGDLVLKEVAKTMRGTVRDTDIVARYGGEEMIMLLKGVGLKLGFEITEKVRSNIAGSKYTDGATVYNVTTSFGVATFRQGDTVDSIIKRADEGLYKAKEAGRNVVCSLEELPV